MPVMPAGYYNRFNVADGDEEVSILAGRVLQSAELNEMQTLLRQRTASVSDVLFAEGAVVRGAGCVVDAETGAVTLDAGAVYVQGAIRAVSAANLGIPTDQLVAVGVYVTDTVVTELEDPSLKDPATGTRNYQQAGAVRWRKSLAWGWAGDGQGGEFFAVYQVENGILLSNDPPPALDGVNLALARYDRDSTGGHYVVEGLTARFLSRTGGDMTLSVSQGRARVYGHEVTVPAGVRLVEAEDPDLAAIGSEPQVYVDDAGAGRIDLNHTPIASITAVVCTKRETVTVTHGPYSGASDPLPQTAVVQIVSISQGGTPYVAGTDYKLTADAVDWSLAGAEPAPGSSYDVTYDYLTSVTPDSQDETGFTISGALDGTQVLTSYSWKLPRVDALALDRDGRVTRVRGIARPYEPGVPSVPAGLLRLANVSLTWDADPVVSNDGLRAVAIGDLEMMRDSIGDLYALVATERLTRDATTRDPAATRGVFVDPFLDDDMRDAGIPQDAAVVDGELMLPIAADVERPEAAGLTDRVTLLYTAVPILEQPLRTGEMKINPYMSFAPQPARVSLTPAVDRWTQTATAWTSGTTTRFVRQGHFVPGRSWVARRSVHTTSVVIHTDSTEAEVLRQTTVRFDVEGFGPGEEVSALTFDGLPVTPSPV